MGPAGLVCLMWAGACGLFSAPPAFFCVRESRYVSPPGMCSGRTGDCRLSSVPLVFFCVRESKGVPLACACLGRAEDCALPLAALAVFCVRESEGVPLACACLGRAGDCALPLAALAVFLRAGKRGRSAGVRVLGTGRGLRAALGGAGRFFACGKARAFRWRARAWDGQARKTLCAWKGKRRRKRGKPCADAKGKATQTACLSRPFFPKSPYHPITKQRHYSTSMRGCKILLSGDFFKAFRGALRKRNSCGGSGAVASGKR